MITSLITYSLAVGAIALTVTKSAIFRDFRDQLAKQDKGWLGKKANELFNCPFCFAFWVSLVLMALRPFPGGESLVDRLFYTFTLMGGGSLVSGAIFYMLKYALTEPGEK
jgi:hypothetical protein